MVPHTNDDMFLSQGSESEAWKDHIDAILRAKDLDDFQYCHAMETKFRDTYIDAKTTELEMRCGEQATIGERLDPDAADYAARLQEVMLERLRYDALLAYRNARPVKAAQVLLSAVAPSLIERVSSDSATGPYKLWKLLEQQSKPFRYLDLPAEMQNRITALALANGIQDITAAQPGITRVSRQIRRETLPIYYASTTFHIRPRKNDKSLHGNNKTLGSATEALVSQWIKKSVGDNANHLRRAVLHLDYEFRKRQTTSKSTNKNAQSTGIFSKSVEFTFTEERSLKVTADNSCDTKFKIQQLQITVESQRRMLKLTGNSIVLALLHNIDLWNILKWKH